MSDFPRLQASLRWAAAFQDFLQLQGQVQECLAAEALPVLMALHMSGGLGVSTTQYVTRLAALSRDIDDTCAALDQLDADMTEHANFLATYHDQVADLSRSNVNGMHLEDTISHSVSASQLAAFTAAWDSREDTASQLRDRAETLHTHQASLTAKMRHLFSQAASLTGTRHQAVQRLDLVPSALAKLAAVLQQIAGASQHLPSNSSEAIASRTPEWRTTVFIVQTIQSVLSTCFSADSSSKDDLRVFRDNWQFSIARRTMEAVQTALTSWNQMTLVPCLLDQLQRSVNSLAPTQQQELEVDAPNGIAKNVQQDLDALTLGLSSSSVSRQSSRLVKDTARSSAADLVPFSDFDNALAGADQMLESALEDPDQLRLTDTSLELDPQSDSPAGNTQTGMADIGLVPFSDFDDGLGGADESLEAANDDSALEAEAPSQSSQDARSSAAAPSTVLSSQAQYLSESMTRFVLSVGATTAAEQQAAALATVRAKSEFSLESGALERQLAGLEWEHEGQLQEAVDGGLGQPVVITPKDPAAEPNWSLNIRRSQLLNALESSLSILADVEDAWLAWCQASAQTEARLKHALASSRPHYGLHDQLFETRQQWLSGYDEMAGWLERTAQNVLQLEHSREGVVWSLSAGVDKNSFVECSALLQQRQYMVSALDAAKEQVMTAQQAMPQLQQQASDAAARLQPAQAEERQQGQCFAQQAPKLLQVAATLLQPVQDCQVAAQEVLPGLDAMQAALKDVLGQIEGSHAAQDIRDSMSSVQQQLSGLQQQASALQQSLAAVAVAADQNLHASKLVPLSTGSPQSKPVKGMSKSKKAALILDAMKPLLSTALEQVQLPVMDGLAKLGDRVQGLPQHAKTVARDIQQAYGKTLAQPVNSLVLASDVADAQPPSSDASHSTPMLTAARSTASSSHSSSAGSQSYPAVLVQTAGDDLEQDSKAVLKPGVQDDILNVNVQSGSKQHHSEQALKAQRKVFAAATLNTFQSKLFGHDGASQSLMKVEQLVDQIVGQATSLDNLCQMYEGWTAWI